MIMIKRSLGESAPSSNKKGRKKNRQKVSWIFLFIKEQRSIYINSINDPHIDLSYLIVTREDQRQKAREWVSKMTVGCMSMSSMTHKWARTIQKTSSRTFFYEPFLENKSDSKVESFRKFKGVEEKNMNIQSIFVYFLFNDICHRNITEAEISSSGGWKNGT